MTNHLKTFVLLGGLTALLIAAGSFVAPGYMPVVLLLAVGMNVGAYFFSDRIVLRMHGAHELDPASAPDLHRMVAELAARTPGIKKFWGWGTSEMTGLRQRER